MKCSQTVVGMQSSLRVQETQVWRSSEGLPRGSEPKLGVEEWIRILNAFFFKKNNYLYLFESHSHKEAMGNGTQTQQCREWERKRERSLTPWFISRMATMEPDWHRNLGASPSLSGVQGPKHSDHPLLLSQVNWQGAGLQVEHPGMCLAHLRCGVRVHGFTGCATVSIAEQFTAISMYYVEMKNKKWSEFR